MLLFPESFDVSELSYISNEHTGSFTIPKTMDFSTISGTKSVSTVANYLENYVGLFYITVYDSEGGTEEFYFIVTISAAASTIDPLITLIIFGIIIAISLFVVIGIFLSQRGKSRRTPRSQYYQDYYYPSPEERQNYPSEYYSEKIPVSTSEFQQGRSYSCRFCGRSINTPRKFCPHCGESLFDI